MTPAPRPFHPELLLAHGDALRRLARGLLRDPHEAEDALQETWARALAARPPATERAGAWLRAVLRSVVHKRLRGAARRAERERRSARPERVEATDVALAHRQTLKRVTAAVLALPEPAQTVILLRFFEGLPPRAIAERLGVPVTTVQSRLQRALAALRTGLDDGDPERRWTHGLAALTGLAAPPLAPPPMRPSEAAAASAGELARSGTRAPHAGELAAARDVSLAAGAPSTTVSLLTAILVMGVKTKLAAAAALVLVAALAFWPRGPELTEPLVPAVVGAAPARATALPAPGPTPAASPSAPDTPPDTREALESPTPVLGPASPLAEPTPEPYEQRLDVLVLDELDRPKKGVEIQLAPSGHPTCTAGTTDAHGRLSIRWRSRTALATVDARAVAPGWIAEPWRRLAVRSGEPQRVTFSLRNAVTRLVLGNRVHRGAFSISMTTSAAAGPSRYPEMRAGDDAHDHGATGPVEGPAETARFVAPLPGDRIASAVGSPGVQDLVVNAQQGGSLRMVPSADAVTPPDAPPVALGSVTGVLRDVAGAPVAGAYVSARTLDGTGRTAVWTDERGAFALAGLPAGPWHIVAGGGDHGLAETELEVVGGQALEWSPQLDRAHELRGRLLDPDSTDGFDHWLVRVVSDDPHAPWSDATVPAPDGTFAIPNLPLVPLRVMVHAPDRWHATPVLVEESVTPDGPPLELALAALDRAPGAVTFEVVDAERAPARDVEGRLVHLASGRGVELVGHGPHALRDLLAGEWVLEVEAGGVALEPWHFWLAPSERHEIGALVGPAPGVLRVEALVAGGSRAGAVVDAPAERALATGAGPVPDAGADTGAEEVTIESGPGAASRAERGAGVQRTRARLRAELVRVGAEVVSFVTQLDAGLPLELELPPGRYELRRGEGAHAFEITAGTATLLRVQNLPAGEETADSSARPR